MTNYNSNSHFLSKMTGTHTLIELKAREINRSYFITSKGIHDELKLLKAQLL